MSFHPMRLIICATMMILSAEATAGANEMSERLNDWRHAGAADTSAAGETAPVRLQSSFDIGESIIRELILIKGQAMLGTPYVFGSNETRAVDCSALIQQLFQSAGIQLPRTTQEMMRIGQPVRRQDIQPGDLLFYRWKSHRLHVAVYLGDDRVLHASPGERGVVISELNKVWRRHFVTARRVMT